MKTGLITRYLPPLLLLAPLATASDYQVPRTEFGHPNLRGVWNFSSDVPLERPLEQLDKETLSIEELGAKRDQAKRASERWENYTGHDRGVGGYNAFWIESHAQSNDLRTSLIVDPPNGRLPELVEGAVIQRGGLGPDIPGTRPVRYRVGGIGKTGPEDRGLSERCLKGFNSGPPFRPSLYNNNVQIFQTRDHVVVMTEMVHDARIIPLGDVPRMGKDMARWSGQSRGHWEGDTLVVETENFTDKMNSFRYEGIGSNMTLVERFTRVDEDMMLYEFTLTDPATYKQPFTVLVPMPRSDGQLYEYACHEGNYGMVNILAGARQEEASQQAQAGTP